MDKLDNKLIDAMWDYWLEKKQKQGQKRKHPSREIFGELVEVICLFGLATQAVREQKEAGGENG